MSHGAAYRGTSRRGRGNHDRSDNPRLEQRALGSRAARRDARRGECTGFAGAKGAGKPPIDQPDGSRPVPRRCRTARPAVARRGEVEAAMSAGAALGADIARVIDVSDLETPCFVTDLGALEANLRILADIQNRARCTILLALKGFAQWSTFPLVRRYLGGAT